MSSIRRLWLCTTSILDGRPLCGNPVTTDVTLAFRQGYSVHLFPAMVDDAGCLRAVSYYFPAIVN